MRCILLHGLGQNPSDWDAVVQQVGIGLDISCPAIYDWLPEADASYAHLYQGLEKYCEQFDEPFVLGGLSLGGILALQYALEHSQKVGSLILMGTQFAMPKKMLTFQNIIFRILPSSAFSKMGLSKKDVISLCRSMMDLDFSDNLKSVSCRTLVLCGERDRSNRSASVALKQRLPQAQMVLVSDARHEINVDNPVQVGHLIHSFVQAQIEAIDS